MERMRIGLTGGANLDRLPRQLERAEEQGFTSLWFPGALGGDALTNIAVAARTSTATRVELGTSIVPTYPRHPVVMAQQAIATANAVGAGRFTLGIGVSHRPAVEDAWGLDYEAPARHLDEYLDVLLPLLAGEAVQHDGDEYRVTTQPSAQPAAEIPVLVAALGPAMLRLAGERTAGTITWMANDKAIESTVAPRLGRAAEAAGRPQPRVVVGLPVAVSDEAEGREAAARQFAGYGMLPNYQRILAAGGADGPGEVAVVGDENAVVAAVSRYFDAGATDLWMAPFPVGDDTRASIDRTRSLLADLTSG